MGRFINGVLIGAGIALLVAPMPGEELRRLVRERFEEMRGNTSDNVQMKQYAQGARSTAKQATEHVSDTVKQSAKRAQQAGEGLAGMAKQEVQAGGTKTAPFPSAYPEYVNPETNPNF